MVVAKSIGFALDLAGRGAYASGNEAANCRTTLDFHF